MSKRTRSIDDVPVSSTSPVEEDTQTLSVPHVEEQDEPPRNRSRPDSEATTTTSVDEEVVAVNEEVQDLILTQIPRPTFDDISVICHDLNETIQEMEQKNRRFHGSYVKHLKITIPIDTPFPHADFRRIIRLCESTLITLEIQQCGPLTESIFTSLQSCNQLTTLNLPQNVHLNAGDIPAMLLCPFLPHLHRIVFTLGDIPFYDALMQHTRTIYHLEMYEEESVALSYRELMMIYPLCNTLHAKFLSLSVEETIAFCETIDLNILIVRMENGATVSFNELFEYSNLETVKFYNVQQPFSCISQSVEFITVKWAPTWNDINTTTIIDAPEAYEVILENSKRSAFDLRRLDGGCVLEITNSSNVSHIPRIEIVRLLLKDCTNCETIRIDSDSLELLSVESCPDLHTLEVPCPNLVSLTLENNPSLRIFRNVCNVSPQFQYLTLVNCPLLSDDIFHRLQFPTIPVPAVPHQGIARCVFPHLETMEIRNMPYRVIFIDAPVMEELEIQGCTLLQRIIFRHLSPHLTTVQLPANVPLLRIHH
jgi:hypothetical protein